MKARVFVGNVPVATITKKELEDIFGKYGKIIGKNWQYCSKFKQSEDSESCWSIVRRIFGPLFSQNNSVGWEKDKLYWTFTKNIAYIAYTCLNN